MNLRRRIILLSLLSGMLFSSVWINYSFASTVYASNTAYLVPTSIPEKYVVWDRRPSENKIEETFIALRNIDLVSRPHGTNIVKTIYPQSRIKGISCVVYSNPSKHAIEVTRTTKVLKRNGNYKNPKDYVTLFPGTYVYLVMYIGEGYYYALYNNQIISVPPCIENLDGNRNPWARYVGETTNKDLGVDFWMCYRADDGTVGWIPGLGGAETEWQYNYHRKYGR